MRSWSGSGLKSMLSLFLRYGRFGLQRSGGHELGEPFAAVVEAEPVGQDLAVVLAPVGCRAAHPRFGGGEAIGRLHYPAPPSAPVVDIDEQAPGSDAGRVGQVG